MQAKLVLTVQVFIHVAAVDKIPVVLETPSRSCLTVVTVDANLGVVLAKRGYESKLSHYC